MFKALVVDNAGGSVIAAVQQLDESLLPPGNVTLAVEYSTVNYKDGLVVTGAGGLVKQYPHSDSLLNAYAKFACIGEDAAKYWELRPAIEQRRSAAVWGHSATVESCDGHFKTAHRPGPVVGP